MSNKLVRLTSTETNGLFDAQFNDPLLIKPMSSVALQSANINIVAPQINITSGVNSNINITAGTQAYEAAIEENVYTKDNYLDLLNNIMDEANLGLECLDNPATPRDEIGTQVNVAINNENKIEIQMERGRKTTMSLPDDIKNTRVKYKGVSTTDFTLKKSAALPASNDLFRSFAYGKTEFNKASGVFQLRIKEMAAVPASGIGGFAMGLVHKSKIHKLHGANPSFQLTDFTLGITTGDAVATNYAIKVGQNDPAFVDSGVAPERVNTAHPNVLEHDILEIRVTEGVAKIVVNQHTAGTQQLGADIPINIKSSANTLGDLLETEFKCVVCIRAALAELQLDRVTFIEDPYDNTASDIDLNDTGVVSGALHALGAGTPITPPDNRRRQPLVVNMVFPTRELAQFLGYNSVNLNPNGTALGFQESFFLADETLKVLMKNERFIVEMLNLNIDSYDGFLKRKVNLLHSLQLEQAQVGSTHATIKYEPNEIIYLDLNNAQELRLTNLRARVVSEQYDNIDTEGFNVMNLLFK